MLWLSALFAVTCICHKYRNQDDPNNKLNFSHQNIHSHKLIQPNPLKCWYHWNSIKSNEILTPHNHMIKISHKTILVPLRRRLVWGLCLAHQWVLTWVIQRTDYPQSQVFDEEDDCAKAHFMMDSYTAIRIQQSERSPTSLALISHAYNFTTLWNMVIQQWVPCSPEILRERLIQINWSIMQDPC